MRNSSLDDSFLIPHVKDSSSYKSSSRLQTQTVSFLGTKTDSLFWKKTLSHVRNIGKEGLAYTLEEKKRFCGNLERGDFLNGRLSH